MRKLIAAVLVLLLSGCAAVQTRGGFIDIARKHTFWYIVDQHVVNKPFGDVISTLRKEWAKCYTGSSTTSHQEGGITTSRITDTYHPKIVRVSSSLVQFTVQFTTTGATSLQKDPPGGHYILALNAKRLGPQKTELDWYSPKWGWSDDWVSTKNWVAGKTDSCAN